MSEANGCQAHFSKRLGEATYWGRQGRTHYFSAAFADGTSERLAVAQLTARVAIETKHPARLQ